MSDLLDALSVALVISTILVSVGPLLSRFYLVYVFITAGIYVLVMELIKLISRRSSSRKTMERANKLDLDKKNSVRREMNLDPLNNSRHKVSKYGSFGTKNYIADLVRRNQARSCKTFLHLNKSKHCNSKSFDTLFVAKQKRLAKNNSFG